ncbi:pyridoxal phosphate-dependent decarboxylase family protein [Paraburkholderia strydomiana]|uniref:pyridoxal phosphate-dependent decarboxylase family protein n=1 Tax=Paraburkholderia strydomiana TaxID=1245417 RepID=UPI002865935F|nr:pyridoxal-dependent decarboxylase [Paraburkholderia strydomiana]MDR7009333.1 glutamate/tyrosine decarboxylase-like PLP-dependent enzyme [Paraburkholderia strydomiana]
MTNDEEAKLLTDADRRAARYLQTVSTRRVFPDKDAVTGLVAFDEPLPDSGRSATETLAMLDDIGSPATVTTNGPRYFGFVVGAALPAPAAAERLMLAWDNGAPLALTSPVSAKVEEVAARWLLEILDLPRESAVGFGTSATACGLACLAAARRHLLHRAGWDADLKGVHGGPEIKVVVSEKIHVVVLKALRVLGFGLEQIIKAPTDENGRIRPESLPVLDDRTILCLQAGEVNTGEFDPFAQIIPVAKAAGAWVHVDGAFGLWARAAASVRHLTAGIDGADSWTVDGHKWLNTPYDCAMGICRDADALAAAMNSDAVYATGSKNAQKNLTLEFSRRARGIPVWAALRSLGKDGVAEMVERHIRQAQALAGNLRSAGFDVLNRVVLNQVIACGTTDEETEGVRLRAEQSGETWFGPTVWNGRKAFRLSVSSWRTTDEDIARVSQLLQRLKRDWREADH